VSSNTDSNIPPEIDHSVALVSSYDINGDFLGYGSACLMGPSLLLTNRHVVEGASDLTIEFTEHPKLAGIAISVRVLYSPNPNIIGDLDSRDFAVLKIKDDQKNVSDIIKPLKFGDSDVLKKGDLIYAYGYPSIGGGIVDPSVTQGIVSNTSFSQNESFMKINCNIYNGNSGGPSINKDGEVVGINTYTSNGAYAGQGLSLKINDILKDSSVESINWLDTQPIQLEK
jgi:serine protease Do